jgi:tungstate transport system ATP-binding protein
MLSLTSTFGREQTEADKTVPVLPLEVRQLVYTVGGQRLIDGINLTLTHGSRTVVLGPNGAGKSLLLRLLHGLLEPSHGSIVWGAAPLNASLRRRQAMVFQRPVLLRRSVRANIHFVLNLSHYSRTERAKRLQHVLDIAGLSALVDRPARVLSIGEQQRLAIARALAVEPEVLFLDEPTASLDPTSVAAIEDIIRAADAQGTKIILVTHDLGQARRLAGDIVFLHQGQVAEHTHAEQFFSQPTSGAARAYLNGQLLL